MSAGQGAVRRTRIVVATADPLTPRMAGPAIRAWQIATALAATHEVRLVTTSECSLTSPDVDVRRIAGPAIRGVSGSAVATAIRERRPRGRTATCSGVAGPALTACSSSSAAPD